MPSTDQMPSSDEQQADVENKSRRNFLKAAVVASAAVAVAGGAAGFAIASGKAPTPFLSFVGFVASGSCININQGAKLNDSNPNDYLQVLNSYLDSFGTVSSTQDGSGNYPITFTRCGNTGTITFTLTDKTDSSIVMYGTLVETGGNNSSYSYKSGSNGELYLGYTNLTGNTTHEYPAGSCLTLSCS